MSSIRPITRRLFLRQFGTASFAIAVLGLGACSSTTETSSERLTSPDATKPPATTTPPSSSTPPEKAASVAEPVDFRRVDLGFVSAYILIRAGIATIVDTGVPGSGPDIEAGLRSAGLGWSDVEHLILTHRHDDHIGSAEVVLQAATAAVPYAGEADIPRIQTSRSIVPVGDGDEVFGLEIIDTPGHTPGHISVLDPAGGVLLAGDALNGADDGVAGPNPSFSSDMELANSSVKKLAGYVFETALFGHGEPVMVGADARVAALAANL